MNAEAPRTSRPHRPSPIVLSEIVREFSLESAPGGGRPRAEEIHVTGVTLASAQVRPGDLYVATPGARFHGAQFVPDALARGAVAVVTDSAGAERLAGTDVPLFVSPVTPRDLLGRMSARIYGTGAAHTPLYAVTGTNGKTSTAYFLEAIMTQLGVRVGLSSTAERRVGDETFSSSLTTPEAPENHALLARMRELDAEAVVIEVSAHALTRHRVDGLRFDVSGFTNLSHDHLDDYDSMEDYFRAKALLFSEERSRFGVISLDSVAGARMAKAAEIPITTISSLAEVPADWTITVRSETSERTEFAVSHPAHGTVITSIPIIGRHMAANAGLAIAMLVESGISLGRIRAALEDEAGIRASIPGRSDRIPVVHGPAVFVDSGHTPDAFEKLLEAVRRVVGGRIIMVAGANGNRDTTKREEMGEVSARGSDVLIVTDHQPRDEDPGRIRRQVLDGARSGVPAADVREIADPTEAIREAAHLAGPRDAIVWAGLAGKDYREVAGEKIPFSVPEVTRRALREAGWTIED